MIVRVRAYGASSPGCPATVPVAVTCWPGPYTSSSTAVIVTVPALYVCPVAIFSSRFALNVKLSASAAATAETVTGTGSLAAGLRTAVTVLTPSFS